MRTIASVRGKHCADVPAVTTPTDYQGRHARWLAMPRPYLVTALVGAHATMPKGCLL